MLDLRTKVKLYKTQELLYKLKVKVTESKWVTYEELDNIDSRLQTIIDVLKNSKPPKLQKQNSYLKYMAFVKNKKGRKK
jgi:hypothetical protein